MRRKIIIENKTFFIEDLRVVKPELEVLKYFYLYEFYSQFQ